jgi:hypothetical protein
MTDETIDERGDIAVPCPAGSFETDLGGIE